MIEFIKQPWHWSITGILIGLTVPLLYLIGNKPFGISSSFRHICAACIPGNALYFKYDWKKETWNIYFVAGIVIGGIIGASFLANPGPMQIALSTKEQLAQLGVTSFSELEPLDIFSFKGLFSAKGFILIVIGGFLVGFGTRYAGGCTSGHSITGISNFQVSSIAATICFMIGGFITTWLLLPLIFKL